MHLGKVLKQVIIHEPSKAVQRFEEISYMVKHGKDLNEFLKLEECKDIEAVAKDLDVHIQAIKEHFVIPQPDEDGVVAPAEPLATEMPDLLSDSKLYAWASIGFGEQETYLL